MPRRRRRTSKTSLLLLPEMKDVPAQPEELGPRNILGCSVSKEPCQPLEPKWLAPIPLDLDGGQGGSKSDLGFLLACTLHFPKLCPSFPPWFPPTMASWQGPGLKCPFHRSENKEPLSTWESDWEPTHRCNKKETELCFKSSQTEGVRNWGQPTSFCTQQSLRLYISNLKEKKNKTKNTTR